MDEDLSAESPGTWAPRFVALITTSQRQGWGQDQKSAQRTGNTQGAILSVEDAT